MSESVYNKVEITYSNTQDRASLPLVEAFEKLRPDVKVNFRAMPDDPNEVYEQYMAMFTSGSSEIDVMDIDVVWPAQFAHSGYLLPLDDLIGRDGLNMEEYSAGAMEATRYNGKQWGIPRYQEIGHLFYRKDIISPPPETWEDLIAQAEAFQGEKGTKYGYVMQAKKYEGLICNAVEFMAAYGGRVVDEQGNVVIHSPESIQGLNVMKRIVDSSFVPRNILTYMEPESEHGFNRGESVFNRNWPCNYTTAQDEKSSKIVGMAGIAPLPRGDVRSAATLGGWMTAINMHSRHREAAWDFVKFITGAAGQKIQALVAGSPPTLVKLYDDDEIRTHIPFFADPGFAAAIHSAVPRPVSPIYPRLSGVMQTEIHKFLSGEQSAEQAVHAIERQVMNTSLDTTEPNRKYD